MDPGEHCYDGGMVGRRGDRTERRFWKIGCVIGIPEKKKKKNRKSKRLEKRYPPFTTPTISKGEKGVASGTDPGERGCEVGVVGGTVERMVEKFEKWGLKGFLEERKKEKKKNKPK